MCCCAVASIPPPEKVTPDTPLRLEIAAVLAFPDGSMTAAGLRREGARGRLVIERIAGKDFTTLANIERMRELCQLHPKELDFGSAGNAETRKAGLRTPPSTSSETVDIKRARAAAEMIVAKLKESSKRT
jgi:hypothetical protein